MDIDVALLEEDDGTYSVFALGLPGAVSQGETIDEALQNITEAILELIKSYLDAHEPVPWQPVQIEPGRSYIQRRLDVDV